LKKKKGAKAERGCPWSVLTLEVALGPEVANAESEDAEPVKFAENILLER
jgi:hypothetical protein